jgi:hypothetical protein
MKVISSNLAFSRTFLFQGSLASVNQAKVQQKRPLKYYGPDFSLSIVKRVSLNRFSLLIFKKIFVRIVFLTYTLWHIVISLLTMSLAPLNQILYGEVFSGKRCGERNRHLKYLGKYIRIPLLTIPLRKL